MKLIDKTWDQFSIEQKIICEKYNSTFKPFDKKLKIGISDNLKLEPMNGLRHTEENGTSGWYIWSGEYSEKDDFFKPICAEHLLEILPEAIKYLALDTNYRFLIDKKGYEDVWFDQNLEIKI